MGVCEVFGGLLDRPWLAPSHDNLSQGSTYMYTVSMG